MNVDLKWQCCPSPFCNILKKPLIEKRTSTVTHLLLKKEPQRQRRRRAEEQGGQLENGWWKLGDRVVGDEVGEVYKFGVWPFRWYLHSHTHVEKLKLIFEFSSKNRFWHPEIDFASVKSIWNRFCHCEIDFSHHQCTLKLDLFNWHHPQTFPNIVVKHKHLDNNFKQHTSRF